MTRFALSSPAAVALLFFAAALSLGASAAKPGEPAAPAAPPKPAVIDDNRLLRTVEAGANRLIDAGKTTPAADLIKELDRPRVSVRLRRPGTKPLGAVALYDHCKPSVLLMAGIYKCEKCKRNHCSIATGFVIAESGMVVTNYHVVNAPKNITLVAATADGTVYPVKEVLAASAVSDVAIVQIEGSGFAPLALVADAPVGSDVFVISHPDQRFFTMSKGIVSRYGTVERAGKAAATLQITAEYARGSSGGPVMNDSGDVIGMASSTVSVYYEQDHGKQENLQMVLNQCVPAAQILALIQSQ